MRSGGASFRLGESLFGSFSSGGITHATSGMPDMMGEVRALGVELRRVERHVEPLLPGSATERAHPVTGQGLLRLDTELSSEASFVKRQGCTSRVAPESAG